MNMKSKIGAKNPGEKPKRRKMIASEVLNDQGAMDEAFQIHYALTTVQKLTVDSVLIIY